MYESHTPGKRLTKFKDDDVFFLGLLELDVRQLCPGAAILSPQHVDFVIINLLCTPTKVVIMRQDCLNNKSTEQIYRTQKVEILTFKS